MPESKLVDAEPGGESTQYESIKTVTEPSNKQQGQLGDESTTTAEDRPDISAEKGEKTAENMRYGQGISESGFGGKTTTSEGTANRGGYGAVEAQEGDTKNTRREQGISGDSEMSHEVGA